MQLRCQRHTNQNIFSSLPNNNDSVNTQTWIVLPLKNPVETLYLPVIRNLWHRHKTLTSRRERQQKYYTPNNAARELTRHKSYLQTSCNTSCTSSWSEMILLYSPWSLTLMFNRTITGWRYLTTTTRIHSVLLCYLNLSVPLRIKEQ